jgi:protein-disulfide isomerase
MNVQSNDGHQTKSEKRIKAAAARQANIDLQTQRRRTTRLITAASIVLVVVVGVVFSVIANKSNTNVTLPPSAAAADHYGIVFNASAKPVIDVWEDFQCPSCEIFETANGQYLHDVATQGKAKVVFHVLSFIGAESTTLTNASGCADKVGKFLDLHSYLYAHQKRENSGFWGVDTLIAAGKAAGITDPAYETCIKDGTYSKWVQNVESSGGVANINQTPTILINGTALDRTTGIYGSPTLFKAALVAAGVN